MFIELIDTTGKKRYVNPDHIIEVLYTEQNDGFCAFKVVFTNGHSWFTPYNIEMLIEQKVK